MLLYLMDAIYFYPSMHATADHEVLTLTSHEHYCAVRAAMKEDTDNSHSSNSSSLSSVKRRKENICC